MSGSASDGRFVARSTSTRLSRGIATSGWSGPEKVTLSANVKTDSLGLRRRTLYFHQNKEYGMNVMERCVEF